MKRSTRHFLSIPFVAASFAGCAHLDQQPVALAAAERDALGCAVAAVSAEIAALSPSILNALVGDNPKWEDQLTALEVRGANLVSCAVAHAVYDALGGQPEATVARIGLDATVELRLAMASAEGGGVVADTPTNRVLRRGRAYLAGKGVAKTLN